MRSVKLLVALAASVSFVCTAAMAREYQTDPSRYKVRDPSWTVCEFSFYAPQASGDRHAGRRALDMWTEPFKPSGKLKFEMPRYDTSLRMTGALADEYLQFLSGHLGRTEEFFQPGDCHFYDSKERAEADIPGMMRKTPRDTMLIPAPTKAMLDRAVRDLSAGDGGDGDEKPAAAEDKPASESKPQQAEKDAAPKGPTAAELAAERRRAADERFANEQKEYEAKLLQQKRQVDEFERAQVEMARKKEEQQLAAQRALDAFRAEQAAHAEQLRQHAARMEEHRRQFVAQQQGASGQGEKRRFQATSAIVDTREAAMAALMRQSLPEPLSDVQCGEVKTYSPPKWTCWGFYEAEAKAGAGSRQ